MAYTQKQYEDLVAAIATGAMFVKYSDKELRFRSLGEMEALKDKMELELGISKKSRRKTVTVYNKGLR